LLEQIAIMSGGAILPFVSYNPQSDLEQQDASFERVVDAIIHRGFVGVKLYPPMGYMPYGNACQARPSDCPVLNNAREIDRKLGRLYAWCVDHNVPVMSHTSHSFGETDAHDDCAAPYGWQKALEKFDGLRVQAGHFGGDSKYAHDKAWAAEYVRLMALPKARNLYVDLSNLGDLFTPGSAVQQAIEPLFSTPVSADSTELAANRMVFGSDWYMTQLSGVSDTYALRSQHERLPRAARTNTRIRYSRFAETGVRHERGETLWARAGSHRRQRDELGPAEAILRQEKNRDAGLDVQTRCELCRIEESVTRTLPGSVKPECVHRIAKTLEGQRSDRFLTE